MKKAKAMTIDTWITNAAPSKIAISFDGTDLTYAQFAKEIDCASGFLRDQGVRHGDRVAWFGFNHPAVFTLLFACARIGAILVPLNWRLSDPEVAEILADCAPKVVFHDDSFASRATELCDTPLFSFAVWNDGPADKLRTGDLNDPILIVYTSGSTGRPKGVVLQQSALVSNAKMSVNAHEMTPDDTALVVLPLFHVGGLNILPTPAFSIGAAVRLHERFDPVATARDLETATLSIVVPTVLNAVMQTRDWIDGRQSNLRTLSIGSTDVPLGLIEAVVDRGIPMIQIYGGTETSPFAIYQSIEESFVCPGSIGRAGCGCDIRIVAPDGTDCPDGVAGEIWVKGDNVFTEYWNEPALTAASLTDGWFHSGDVAERDADGLYWFTDRIKHVIISGGENIYPAEIERLLRGFDGVGAVCVVGEADDKWGQVPVAVIETAQALDTDKIIDDLRPQLASYKRPQRILCVPSLPRNAMGKIVTAQVREMIKES